MSFPRARVALVQTHTFLAKVVEFAAKRERICAINEKKATDYNLQIIWQKRSEGDRAALFPALLPGKPSLGFSEQCVPDGKRGSRASERAVRGALRAEGTDI